MASALIPLANITLSSPTTNVTFSSITGLYRDLLLVCNTTSAVYTGDYIAMKLNGDTGSNYTVVTMGNVSGGNSLNSSHYANSSTGWLAIQGGVNATTHINIMDYAQTDKQKAWISRAGAADYGIEMVAGRWASTAAITSINVYGVNGWNWTAGSSFALYGVKG